VSEDGRFCSHPGDRTYREPRTSAMKQAGREGLDQVRGAQYHQHAGRKETCSYGPSKDFVRKGLEIGITVLDGAAMAETARIP